MAKITIRDVAERAGVSLSTVSRVLNHNPNVDAALAGRVIDAASALGYRPGLAARPLPGAQIALIVPVLENSYYSSIVAGVIDTARENGQSVLVMQTGAKREVEEACLQTALSSHVSGIIFSGGSSLVPTERFPALKNVPLVIAARRQVVPGIPHVYSDNVGAGYLATRYLLKMRRQNIALLVNFWTDAIHDYDAFMAEYNSPAQGACTAFDRFTGYRRALEEEGLEVQPSLLVFSGFSHESGYASAQELLSGFQAFDAVLVPNDRCATGVLRLFNEQRITVPEQVSIICFNGGLMSSVVSPSLTMIEQHNYEVGAQSAVQLNELICGRSAHDVKLDVSLVIKGSTSLAAMPAGL